MKRAKKNKSHLIVSNRSVEPFPGRNSCVGPKEVWKWGSDNLLPQALTLLSRTSAYHRRILNDKADYISGQGFSSDEDATRLRRLFAQANGQGETLRGVIQRIAYDRCLFGNAFLEIVTDSRASFLSLYHQDASRCRVARDGKSVVMHHDWQQFRVSESKTVPLYPLFAELPDGTCRSVYHFKEYEPMFEHYGVPKYVAGLGAAALLYRTDRWNLSRIENAFHLSGVMVLDGQVDSDQEAAQIARMAEEKFSGNPGQVMFLVKNGIEGDTTKFVPMTTSQDGDWKTLHDQAISDILAAHSWFRTLSGMDYTTGFSAERVKHEYHIALNTLIRVEQDELLEPLRTIIARVLRIDTSSMAFINRPPFEHKPGYMRVWEARRADGLDYDPADQAQQLFISQIGV